MYKRQIDDIENINEIDIYGSNSKGIYYSLNSFLKASKPFNGIYLSSNKVIVSNVFEAITLKGIEYNLKNYNTISEDFSIKEYVSEIDLETMKYRYIFKNVVFTKQIILSKDDTTMTLKYDITNENEERIRFSIFPMITYRDMLQMKKANFLKFVSRNIDKGAYINLSVSEGKNLKITSEEAKCIKKDVYISNVKYDVINLEQKKDTYIEDLYIPCQFEVSIKPNETKSVSINILLDDINAKTMEKNIKIEPNSMDEKYVELQKLKKSLKFFEDLELVSLPQNIRLCDINDKINDKNFAMYLNELLLFVKSVDGRYICLNRLNEAKQEIIKYYNIIKNVQNKEYINQEMLLKIKLWLVEMVNKLYEKDEEIIDDKLKGFVGIIAIELVELVTNDEYGTLKNIEISSLIYNALKIYENLYKDPTHEDTIERVQIYVENKFWNEQRRVLKKNIDDLESTACIDMMYAISLSYPTTSKEISIKILDTIFRELYTPYGLRTVSKTSKDANGHIYPKYMAHFIFSNLKQNGTTYASKKIAYNLVKELLLDIGKYVENNVKYVYSEKGINIDYKSLDLYTTAEMIRLYTMFM